MVASLGWYSQLLLLILLSSLFFVFLVIFRRRWDSRATRLRVLLRKSPPEPGADLSQLAPLLLLEEDHPAFTEILGVVLEKYPVRRFHRDPQFSEALEFLCSATCSDRRNPALGAAMSQIVKCFLGDPDVEYSCRAELRVLVRRFLTETERRGYQVRDGR